LLFIPLREDLALKAVWKVLPGQKGSKNHFGTG
jgi:L-amino acid N-acyltransferase YncA